MASKKTNKNNKKLTTVRWDKDRWSSVANHFTVWSGSLKRPVGKPVKPDNLFTCIAEKLPWASLDDVEQRVLHNRWSREGVYIAHDSVGCPRYIGRGSVFTRLKNHKIAHPDELVFFSFFLIPHKKHQRDIETLLIRSVSYLLVFNQRKKRDSIVPGNVRDYEAGTAFFERWAT